MRESVAGQHLARLVEQDDCARGHRRWRRCLVLVLLVCCGTLPVLAQASPPDPTWLPGIYDNADYDDVIGLLTDTAAIRELQLIATGPAPSRLLARFGWRCIGRPRRVSARLPPPLSSNYLTVSPWVRVTIAHRFIPRRHASRAIKYPWCEARSRPAALLSTP